jgi:hypothetical protein
MMFGASAGAQKPFIRPSCVKCMVNVTTLLSDERIQYDGLFDLNELYKHAYNWFNWRKFDIAEKKYSEKAKATGKEVTIEWDVTKSIDEYSGFEIKVKWELKGVQDVDVKKDSGTAKMQKGEVNVWISANLKTDRQDYWTQNVMQSFLRSFYDKYLYRSTFERLKGELWKTGWDFFNEMKSFLNLYRY